jgi:hypothetical protein
MIASLVCVPVTKDLQFATAFLYVIENKRVKYGGGGGSRNSDPA